MFFIATAVALGVTHPELRHAVIEHAGEHVADTIALDADHSTRVAVERLILLRQADEYRRYRGER